MEKYNLLISLLIAVCNYAKDIHYNVKGSAFYGKHLFADVILDGLDEVIDDIRENILLGNGVEPLHSSKYLRAAAELVPPIAPDDRTNFVMMKGLVDRVRGMIKGINKMIPGEALDIKLPNYVSIQRFRPRLAKGGIINMPGRGVPVGNAIGGEKAPEGVIPLTDSQQMALLGEAIGKYININATVPVYVGNRMVAREIKRINAEDNFAYNR